MPRPRCKKKGNPSNQPNKSCRTDTSTASGRILQLAGDPLPTQTELPEREDDEYSMDENETGQSTVPEVFQAKAKGTSQPHLPFGEWYRNREGRYTCRGYSQVHIDQDTNVPTVENPLSSLVFGSASDVLSNELIIKMQWRIFSRILHWETQWTVLLLTGG
jgi:hypothetical protein